MDQKELPKRKTTRWQNFDYDRSDVYFITVCTKNRTCRLSHVGDGALDVPYNKLTAEGEIVQRHLLSHLTPDLCIEKYIIMPNHVHFLLFVRSEFAGTSRAPSPTSKLPPSPTNRIVPRFVSTFKRYCRAEIGEKIFQRSYHDHVIRNQDEYNRIWSYIERNPEFWKKDCFYSVSAE